MAVVLQVITGILGSGKTSCLQHLIEGATEAGHVGVVVGEFAELGYDGDSLAAAGADVAELTRTGLGEAERSYAEPVKRLIAKGHRRIFLETSGVANIARIAQDLLGDPALDGKVVFGPTLVIVDAGAFNTHAEHFADQLWAQIGVADRVVINKVDKAPQTSLDDFAQRIAEHNSDAEVLTAYMGQVRLGAVLDRPEGFTARLTRMTQAEGLPRDFQSFVYQSDLCCFERAMFGHRLLNLPGAHIARFKGVVRSYDRSWPINGLPGQLDWESHKVSGQTRIAFIGLNLADREAEICALLDRELKSQADDGR